MTIKEMVAIKEFIGDINIRLLFRMQRLTLYYQLITTFQKEFVDIYLESVYGIRID